LINVPKTGSTVLLRRFTKLRHPKHYRLARPKPNFFYLFLSCTTSTDLCVRDASGNPWRRLSGAKIAAGQPDPKGHAQIIWIYHTLGMIIPHNFENFWSGHFFSFIESWEELQVSFTQICFGLYKQAFVSLRSGLE
jgi:hypothetical protein